MGLLQTSSKEEEQFNTKEQLICVFISRQAIIMYIIHYISFVLSIIVDVVAFVQ